MVNAQALEEKDLVIDAQMGYPNLSYWKSGASFSHLSFGNESDNIHKSIGQFILSTEFFLTDKIGLSIGGNFGYYYDYQEWQQTVYDGNTGEYTTNTYFSELRTTRFRFYVGPHFHLLRSERLDTYFGTKVGIKKSYFNERNNYPDGSGQNYIGFEFPVGLRLSYGLRYFVTEEFAINTEFGLGGPLVSFGLSYKIKTNL